MAAIQRRYPLKAELERIEATEDVRISDVPDDKRNTDRKLSEQHKAETLESNRGRAQGFNNMRSLSRSTTISERYSTVECDICRETKSINSFLYCAVCKQKFCDVCAEIHSRFGSTRNHHESTEKCWTESQILDQDVTHKIIEEHKMNTEQLSSFIINELGVQVCFQLSLSSIEIRTPSSDVLELAIDTIHAISESKSKPIAKRVRQGAIEWRLQEQHAKIVAKLFRTELNSLIEIYDVVVKIKQGNDVIVWPLEHPIIANESKSVADASTYFSNSENEIKELTLRSSFQNYYAVDCEVEEIKDELQTLLKAVILRPKQDDFRMKMYAISQENSDDVICHIEEFENTQSLVIQGREGRAVEQVKQEFLSLFCKECSSCHEESSRPTFLECKHVLCNDCVRVAASPDGKLRCPLCSDSTREKTPVTSLQLQCIQAIDQLLENDPGNKRPLDIVRKKSSLRTRQLSTKIPKFLLNKWKKMSGGLARLKSMIENNYGIKVAGTDENLRIYGQQQEILDLAVQSLERLNEKPPQTGITQRLAEKCVEWRLREDHARIAHFLFNKELNDLKKKFQSMKIQVFTDSEPAIVDIKCGYGEFLKVKFEMEELENDIKNLYSDECVQPKNFYHKVKIQEYLQSKRRDEKVHCTLVEKNNLLVVVIRGRKKEYVSSAKEQLLKW